MPRPKSSAKPRGASRQNTLSFSARSSKITKPSPLSKETKALDLKAHEPKVGKLSQDDSRPASPLPAADVKPPVVSSSSAELAIREQTAGEKEVPRSSEVEMRALKVADAEVRRYWAGKEAERKAPRGMCALDSFLCMSRSTL